ncbi:MAG: gamma-glutamylcyclotransferase family protein [Pseudomonadota bacterium]
MHSDLVGYFGFGSLVNKHTLRTAYIDVVPATLKGWRRHWQARTQTLEEDIALLSIHPYAASSIKGMLVIDRLENLPSVDEREAGYSRLRLGLNDLDLPQGFDAPGELYVYVADEAADKADTGALLQSYIDAVLQGFRNEYGDEGVWHFVETTTGFARPYIKDREAPLYPRSVILADQEASLFDEAMRFAGAGPDVFLDQLTSIR